MTRIILEAVDQSEQRYDTVGDWFWDAEGNLIVRVTGSDPVDQKEVFLVALHELYEAVACFHEGITQAAVDRFDFAFKGEGEPGDHHDAPYRVQHRQAMLLEHMAANFLGLSDYGIVE